MMTLDGQQLTPDGLTYIRHLASICGVAESGPNDPLALARMDGRRQVFWAILSLTGLNILDLLILEPESQNHDN